MNAAQNNQLLLHVHVSNFQKILKFCYFISLCLVFVSCKNASNTKTTEDANETVETESETVSTANSKTILFFGDSITAGYGLDSTNDAYPAVIQETIDSLDLNYTVVNSGVSGETTAGGRSRIDWILNQNIDIFLLELGANDGLRGVPISETQANLQAIIDAVKQKDANTKIILTGMELPPNMGNSYTSEFRNMYAELAQKNDVAFIPFILKDVGGIPELNQNDGIHPTVKGHKIIASTVWETLQPLL
ncbi:arylesterase [Jejuia pallidilutea]|uniref:Arylesterase n=1 Tax=Jejuia pallidilutea TaxID=504487 RepID=A0A090W5C3_9FLAO|nr:arylesterase [Jejuia pallidilutea]GAL68818.1 arylesterase precursor [Jejuia pallidilutea]GAL72131.1 arylesterase precursor [Jejuia pallidilutea]GAL90729.1 arylesterase precursor [Jejuia pallidilutea]